MKSKSIYKKQTGNIQVIVLVVIAIAILGAVGFLFWKNFYSKKPVAVSSAKTNTRVQENKQTPRVNQAPGSYIGWQTYSSSLGKYSLKYPQGWTYVEAKAGEITSALASVSFIPQGISKAVVTVSSFQSSASPKDYINPNNSLPLIDSNETPINGNSTYYAKYGDGTYANRVYTVSHGGIITTVAMTESANTPVIDNSAYVSQFDLIAKSLTF
jgi:uncharacterized protein YpmB